jgi:histone-lysine N-methyltransferase SETD3
MLSYFKCGLLLLTASVANAATALEKREQSRDNQAFMAWFERIGAKANGVELSDFAHMGRGVGASKDLRDKDEVMTVPLDYCLSRRTATRLKQRKLGELLSGIRDDADLIAVFLLRQLALGPRSRWAEYITVLPRPGAVSLPLFFSDSELRALHDMGERDVALKAQQKHVSAFDRLKPALRRAMQMGEDGDGGDGKEQEDGPLLRVDPEAARKYSTLDWYKWACALVSSRALTMQGRRYLVPFSDMFNYEPQPQQQVRDHENGAHFLMYHKLDTKNGVFRILADRATSAGAQLFEDYGDNDNYLYLHYHGFVPRANQFDCAKVRMPHILEGTDIIGGGDGETTNRAALLRMLRITPNPGGCLRAEREVPQYIRNWLLASRMPELEAAKCASHLRDTRDWDVAHCMGEAEAEVSWRAALLPYLKRQAAASFTSAADDERILQSSDPDRQASLAVPLTSNEKLAIRFRMGRKVLLGELIFKLGADLKKAETRKVAAATKKKPAAASAAAKKGGAGAAKAEAIAATAATRKGEDLAESEAVDLIAKAKRFNDWIDKLGFPVNSLTVKYVPGMRLGTMAKHDIKAEQPYISVPPAAVMNRASAKKCPVIGAVITQLNKKFPKGDAFHELLFHLVYERFVKKDESFWSPYLDVIPGPDEMVSPSFYTEAQLELLRGSVLYPRVQAYRAKLRRSFDAVSKHVLSQYPEAFKPSATPDAYSFPNYHWAHAVLDSRAIWWSSQRNLVPLLDMINCAEGPDPARVHRTDLDSSRVNAVTLAPWNFKGGEQVFENYGQPNHIYMQYHGFMLEDNTHDCVLLALKIEVSSLRADKALGQRLNKLRLQPEHEFCLKAGPPSPALLEFVRIQHGLPSADDDKPSERARNNARVKRRIKQLVQARLAGYAVPKSEAEQKLKAPSLPFQDKMITLFTLSEMRLLEQVSGYLKWDDSVLGAKDEL